MLFTFVAGLVLISVAGCACVTLKLYYAMPPNLASGLRYLFDFVIALAEFVLKLAYIIVLFLINIITYVLSSVLQFVPYLFKTFSSCLSFLLWIITQLVRGIFGMGDKTTNTLSWLFLLCAIYLYFDHKGYGFRSKPPEPAEELQDVHNARQNQRESDPNVRGREENRNAADDHEISGHNNARRRLIQAIEEQINDRPAGVASMNVRQRGEFRRPQSQGLRITNNTEEDILQLEAENRENENEANSQEEADRTRMHDDNLRNTERELFDDAVPRRPDDNNDTTLCVICLDRERNVAVFPCGHTHLCLTCVQRLRDENGLCPMCQRHIQEFRQIFV